MFPLKIEAKTGRYVYALQVLNLDSPHYDGSVTKLSINPCCYWMSFRLSNGSLTIGIAKSYE